MIRRELAKDPKLANESWDRFLPQFRKRHLTTSEKTAKKNERIEARVEARNIAGIPTSKEELQRKEAGADGKEKKTKKKVYTPFPPAQQPRKVDLQLESGEYFLKAAEKERRKEEQKKQKVSTTFSPQFLLSDIHFTISVYAASGDNGKTTTRKSRSLYCTCGGSRAKC